MDEALETLVDPACLQQPPLTRDMLLQLDVFGCCLYGMLTFMALLSLLLYMEQCAFIYKKLPPSQKTTIMWISGAAPVISTMACLGMWVPRAVMMTDMTSNSFFAVVVYKFVVMLLEEQGGTHGFLQQFSGKPFKISTGPCCCCCPCLPPVPMSRRMLFLLKLASLQYAILRTFFSIFCIILWTNGIYNITNLRFDAPTLWISLFVGVLTVFSLWPIGIIFINTNRYICGVKIIPKYAMNQLVLVLGQLQTSIINILALNGPIACAPPLSPQARGSMLSQQMLIMETFIISIVTRSLYRRTYDPVPTEEHEQKELNVKAALQATLEEHDV